MQMNMQLRMIAKPAMVLGIAGALALGSMTPSEARIRPWVAAGIGLAAGAALASAVAHARAPYYYGPGYAAYAYDPYYAPAPVYVAPGYVEPYYATAPGYNSNSIGPQHERMLTGSEF
jgi:hypothetical protein